MATTEEVFKKNLRSQIPGMRENFRFGYDSSDKFIVWVIGSSVLGIVLLMANSDKLHCILLWTLPAALISLLSAIVFGLVYKLLAIPLMARWMRFEYEYLVFTTPEEDFDTDDHEISDTFLKKYKDFMMTTLGFSDKKFEKYLKMKKTVYPLGFTASKFFYLSIILFVLGFGFIVIGYLT
jgi:hypothetical protein